MSKKNTDGMTESEALYELLWKKHNAVDISKIIYVERIPDGSFMVKLAGKKLNDTQLANLRSEAAMIEQSQLWKIMTETLKNTAHQHMFTQMKTLEDSHYGKTMLFNLSIFDTILTALGNPHIQKTATSYRKLSPTG